MNDNWMGRKAPNTPISIAVANMPAPQNGSGNGSFGVWLEATIWILIVALLGILGFLIFR